MGGILEIGLVCVIIGGIGCTFMLAVSLLSVILSFFFPSWTSMREFRNHILYMVFPYRKFVNN